MTVPVLSTIVQNAATLPATKPNGGRDWGSWAVGMWSSFIVGSTGSLSAGLLGPVVGVQGVKNYIILSGGTFLLTGLLSLAAYLHNHPAPEPWNGTDRRGA